MSELNTKGINAHSNHGWVDKTWCIFGGIILGKWKTFDTWLSQNMQTICPNRNDSSSPSTYDGKKFHQLIFFLSPKTTTTTTTKRSRKIQPKTRSGPNVPVDNYWSGLLYFHTNISFTSKGELTHCWVPFTALECKCSAVHYKLVGPLWIWLEMERYWSANHKSEWQ